ncbi:MAG: response regulator, partial [Nitrospirales bacterium]
MGISKLTALIVEDSPVTREFLTYLLEEEAGFQVVGAAKNGKEGVDLAERLKPDIVLMDVHMPELNGLEATKAIMTRTPTRIVMVSASLDPQDVALSFQALNAGALALVEKPKGPNDPNYEVTVRELVMTLRLMSEV